MYNRIPIIIKDDFGIKTIVPQKCLALQKFPKSFVFPNISMMCIYNQC